MRKTLLIFVAMMVYAIWAAAQTPSHTWWEHFKPVPSGTVLATQTPAHYTPTPTYTLTSSPTPTPPPPTAMMTPFPTPTKTATATSTMWFTARPTPQPEEKFKTVPMKDKK